jgi:rhodanese-related sulfurtransferase
MVGRGLRLDDVELGAERVAELHGRGAIQLIDVREPDEWRTEHIPGARHLELEQLVSGSGAIARDVPVVFYCRLGARAALAASAFRRAGYDAYSLVGGIVAWRTRELPVEPAAGSAAS